MTETPPPASPAASPLIRLAGVTKRFADADVLTDISLEIAAGETVVICGPSGSGKSTLIRLINQLEEQTGGEISLDGRALASLPSDADARATELLTSAGLPDRATTTSISCQAGRNWP